MKKFLKNIFIIIFVFIISNSGGFMESEATVVNHGPIDQFGRSSPSQGGGRGCKSRSVHQEEINE